MDYSLLLMFSFVGSLYLEGFPVKMLCNTKRLFRVKKYITSMSAYIQFLMRKLCYSSHLGPFFVENASHHRLHYKTHTDNESKCSSFGLFNRKKLLLPPVFLLTLCCILDYRKTVSLLLPPSVCYIRDQ